MLCKMCSLAFLCFLLCPLRSWGCVGRKEIIEKLLGQVVRLSQHKFASNVIEKCLQYSDSDTRQVISPRLL